MKRILPIVLILIILSGCKPATAPTNKEPITFISGVWITYSEVDSMLEDGKYKDAFDSAVNTCKANRITDIFLAVRPFCNSLYKSNLFPQNELAKNYDADLLEYSVKKAHQNEIRLHAWINPYRVAREGTGIDNLPDDSPVKQMTPGDDYIESGGIFLNPASPAAIRLITEGVREICLNYKVDGIHFDDYFYPTGDENFDKVSYDKYKQKNQHPLPLDEYRISSVNSLISSVYTAVKFCSKDIVFSVSPAASIEKNKTDYFADVKAWCENGCVDIIIPQLYFGFEYPDRSYRFNKLLDDWKNLLKNTEAALVIGLGVYKTGTAAEPDREEWKNGKEIIKRQTEICRNDDRVSGYVYFSLSDISR